MATEIVEPKYVEENRIYLDAAEKLSFAQKMDLKSNMAANNGLIIIATEKEKEELLIELSFATGNEKEQIREELEKYGLYEFEPEIISENEIVPLGDSSDVTINTPTVVYDSIMKQWVVSCSGKWKNNNWAPGLPEGNIGGEDGFGVGYTNTKGTYSSSVVSASATIWDKDESKSKTTSHRADGNGKKGFGFRLQDYTSGSKYIGYRWYGSVTYDKNFGSYSGTATAYYLHTWSNTTISSVTFGASNETAGVQATFSSSSNRFKAYSSDKKFGS